MTFELTSPAFASGEAIPARFTCDGEDLSPPLRWTDPPSGTRTYALIVDDPDAPSGLWVHWVLWNIPAAVRSLEEGMGSPGALAEGPLQGVTDFRRPGYGGPCPPSGTHRYFFKLYALDTALNLPAGATKVMLEKAMTGHVLGQAQLMGTYRRMRR